MECPYKLEPEPFEHCLECGHWGRDVSTHLYKELGSQSMSPKTACDNIDECMERREKW